MPTEEISLNSSAFPRPSSFRLLVSGLFAACGSQISVLSAVALIALNVRIEARPPALMFSCMGAAVAPSCVVLRPRVSSVPAGEPLKEQLRPLHSARAPGVKFFSI